jgi:hypothetical protein
LQYLHQLQADLAGEEEIEPEVVKASLSEDLLARNDAISCELGIRYPVLQAILSGRKNHQSLMVRIYYISCIVLDIAYDIVYDIYI